jgi:translocation and assembly module TamB
MRRFLKIIRVAIGLVIGLPLLGLAIVIIGANTDTGRHLLSRIVADVTGGMVAIDGLSGTFPDALRAKRIVVSDPRGAWLTIDETRFDWSPLRLIRGEFRVDRLVAARIAVARLPEPAGASASGTGGELPVAVAVDDLHIDRLELAAPAAGIAAALRVAGNGSIASTEQGRFALEADRLDGAGSYKLSGSLRPDAVSAQIAVAEPARGIVSGIAGLPDLGALSVTASLDGPRTSEELMFQVAAGPLTANGRGKIDLVGQAVDLDLNAATPAMAPRPDLDWQSARLDAQLHGPLTGPAASGHLDIAALRAGGGSVDKLTADLKGGSGTIALTASASGLRLPGAPGLFADAPVELRGQAELQQARRPVSFTLSHPLLAVSGVVDTAGPPAGSFTLSIPSLAPFAAVAGTDLQGHAQLTARLARQADAATNISAEGTVGLTGGLPRAVALIGDRATLALTAALHGSDMTLENLAINGKAISASAKGAQAAGAVDLDWQAALSDLSALSATASGTLAAHGRVTGTFQNLSATAQLDGDAAVAGAPKEKFTASLTAQGLPGAPSGKIEADGKLAGAPLRLAAAARRQDDGTLVIALDRLQWKSADGAGELTLPPGASVPLGQLHMRMTQLADLAPLTGSAIKGSIDANFDSMEQQGRNELRLRALARQLVVGAGGADQLTLDARLADPTGHPTLNATVAVDGVRQGAASGNARLVASGPTDALGVRLSSDLRLAQGPATLTATATVRLPRHDVQLNSLDASFAGETARLLAPARIDLANGLAVDSLRIGIGGATFALAGRVSPTLALTLSARDITPTMAKPFLPDLRGTGTITLNGELRGALAAPEGTLRLSGRGLSVTSGGIGGLPPADIDATATLARTQARIDARVTAGKSVQLTLAGSVPLEAAAPLALRLNGNADLALLDPVLTPNGRRVRGQAAIDLALGGTLAAPRPTGTVRLTKGEVQDFVQGVHITDLTGSLQGDGNGLRIDQLTGRSGSGTLSAGGTVGLFQPNLPVSLTVTARQARLLASELVDATADVDLTIRGDLDGGLTAGGKIQVARANINVPNALPSSVAVLNVRRPGTKRQTASTPGPSIGLALTIDAPQQVFVRGHGLDAEMGGTLKLGGTATAPTVDGGLELRRGTFSLAGQTLTFSSGKVSFAGTGVSGKIDPTLDFTAQSTANNLTATLRITGYADAPKLELSSTPQLPQDEILGRLLFGQSTQQLSPFQLAQVAQAAASFGGVGGGDPLGSLRGGLGLDRLSVGSGSGSGATVEAGKYVANGVYVGARQGTSGGSQAQVQIDLTKHLKLQTTLGTGGTPATGITPQNDPGSSIGLTYGFEY